MPASLSPKIVCAELTRADGVDADRRLVEEDHRRVVQQAAGDVEPLAHAARVPLDPLLLAAREPDELEQLLDPRPLAAGLDAVELGEVAQVVERGEPLVEAAVAAEDVADPLPHPARVLDDVAPEHARLPRRRDEERDQHLDRRRLAGAVRAEEAEELALLDREADAAHGLDLERAAPERAGRRPVGAVEVDRFDDGRHEVLTLAAARESARGGKPNHRPRAIDMSPPALRQYPACGRVAWGATSRSGPASHTVKAHHEGGTE